MAFNPFSSNSWLKNANKFLDFGNSIKDWWHTITGTTEKKHLEKADTLAEETQRWNEQFSEKQLQEQTRQFEKSQELAQANLQFQRESADKNFQMQQDVFNAQQRENELTRQREDTAYQRQVADLKAAGLSPLMASNGAAASGMSVGNAPQYDSSGIGNAYGSYIQMAQEYAQLRTMAQGQYASRRQEAINQRIGAAMALSSMYQNRRQMFANNAISGFNIATNIAKMKKQNQYVDEQIKTMQAQREWNESHNYGKTDLLTLILPTITKTMEKMGMTSEKISDSIANFAEKISELPSKIKDIMDSGTKEDVVNEASHGNDYAVKLCENLSKDDVVQALAFTMFKLNDKELYQLAEYYAPKLPENRKQSVDDYYNWIKRDGWSNVLQMSFGIKLR